LKSLHQVEISHQVKQVLTRNGQTLNRQPDVRPKNTMPALPVGAESIKRQNFSSSKATAAF